MGYVTQPDESLIKYTTVIKQMWVSPRRPPDKAHHEEEKVKIAIVIHHITPI